MDVHDTSHASAAVEALIAEAALKTERSISLARILYGTALLVFTMQAADRYGEDSVLFSSISLGLFVGFSVFLFVRLFRIRNPRWVFPLSVAMDASVAFTALLPDVLWPWPGYGGMINLISLSGMLISTFASGFRLSVKVALFGGILNSAYFAVLMLLDRKISGHPSAAETEQVALFSIFLFGAAALAVVLALLTRRLVRRGAQEAVRADRARQRLNHIVQDHHDVRTTLTSVTLCADLIKERLTAGDPSTLAPVQSLADKLQGELKKVKAQIDFIKGETFSELVALKKTEAVDPVAAIEDGVAQAQRLFPDVVLRLTPPERHFSVAIAGGRPILERVLFNLLVNACEGDGPRGAKHVELTAKESPRRGFVQIEIADDGPGFPDYLLRGSVGDKIISTKAGGSGLGLLLANGLVQASAGSLSLRNRDGGGAVVTLELKS